MRVLVACERSGKVRDAFLAKGHDSWSCDLHASDTPGPHHQCDVREILNDDWDLLIAHPVCRYLANSGVRWLHTQEGRWENMREGAAFFKLFLDCNIPKKAIENPIMHRYAVEIIRRRADQVIQPWMFGHPEKKATCLWLDQLPLLVATDNVKARMQGLPKRETDKIHYASPGPDRERLRSETYSGIANAFANQWG